MSLSIASRLFSPGVYCSTLRRSPSSAGASIQQTLLRACIETSHAFVNLDWCLFHSARIASVDTTLCPVTFTARRNTRQSFDLASLVSLSVAALAISVSMTRPPGRLCHVIPPEAWLLLHLDN